ncbi:unnamed protein product [Mytilus coruscus]|uniref:Uncharacterized protein n=1 Tax=Mytilus coruscus TaxID=42192 RepID=A0A6J8EFJ2_MYTCO|nr:unnamed protein product [Mytilus coruscus]
MKYKRLDFKMFRYIILVSIAQIGVLTFLIDRTPYLLIGKEDLKELCYIHTSLISANETSSLMSAYETSERLCPSCLRQTYQDVMCKQCEQATHNARTNFMLQEFCAGRAFQYILMFACLVVTLVNSIPYLTPRRNNGLIPMRFQYTLKVVVNDKKIGTMWNVL